MQTPTAHSGRLPLGGANWEAHDGKNALAGNSRFARSRRLWRLGGFHLWRNNLRRFDLRRLYLWRFDLWWLDIQREHLRRLYLGRIHH